LIPTNSPEWKDYECIETDDLMDVVRIFYCVNLPLFEDLQDLGPATPTTSLLGSATTSSSSSSLSSLSLSSWVSKNIKKEPESLERNSSTCAALGIPLVGTTILHYVALILPPLVRIIRER